MGELPMLENKSEKLKGKKGWIKRDLPKEWICRFRKVLKGFCKNGKERSVGRKIFGKNEND